MYKDEVGFWNDYEAVRSIVPQNQRQISFCSKVIRAGCFW